MTANKEHVWKLARLLSCDDQHDLAKQIAANVGYELVPEVSIQEAEDKADVLARIDRLERAVLELNPGLNWP